MGPGGRDGGRGRRDLSLRRWRPHLEECPRPRPARLRRHYRAAQCQYSLCFGFSILRVAFERPWRALDAHSRLQLQVGPPRDARSYGSQHGLHQHLWRRCVARSIRWRSGSCGHRHARPAAWTVIVGECDEPPRDIEDRGPATEIRSIPYCARAGRKDGRNSQGGTGTMAINRRNFIGGAIAAASVSPFASKMAIAAPGASPDLPPWPQGWLRKGLINAGGTHEPYIFVVRRGGQRLDARQTSNYEQSEELIRGLHDSGVEVFHTHLYKGFGMEAEREGME